MRHMVVGIQGAVMNLAAISKELRETSSRYGGIKHYLTAAGDLDRAISAFFKVQDLESMRALNGAVAHAERLRRETAAGEKGVAG